MPTVASLRRKIRALRAKTPQVSYRAICKELHIFKPDGSPDPGMAKLLRDGYEPKLPATRERLGIVEADVCERCHRPLKKMVRKPRPERKPHPAAAWLRNLDGAQRSDDVFHYREAA